MAKIKARVRSLFLWLVAFFCLTRLSYAEVASSAEAPTAAHQSGDSTLVEEGEASWTWSSEIGYESQYNLHGTNLTPDADGVGFISAQVTKSNFTFGISVFHQFGTASMDAASSVFKTTQTRFNEYDLFIEYDFELGPVEVTLGDVQYFDERRTKTFLSGEIFPETESERANELSINLATSKIPHFVPSITYYQTIYRSGFSFSGYLDGELRGEFAINRWLDASPYGLVSVSFREPRDAGGTSTGFSHAQLGIEIPIHLLHANGNNRADDAPHGPTLDFVPFGVYSYHISEPQFGTDRNEVWGGAQFELKF